METRSGMSVIKSKVRLNALLWREFTATQMVEITGLKPESIRTELQRMKAEGLLEVSRAPQPADQKRKRGGQPVLYRLSSDPEKRLTLSRSVEAFHPEAQPSGHPTSRHYARALHLLDQASTEKDSHKCKDLLIEAEDELDFTLVEEGADHAPETVRAYVEFQHGRIAYLRGQDERAEVLLRQARQVFDRIGQSHQAALADEFLLCIETRQRWIAESDYRPQARARCILQKLRASSFRSDPLVRLLADLLEELAETPQDWVIAATIQSMVAASDALQQTAERLSQDEQTLSFKIESQEWRSYMRAAEPLYPGPGHEDVPISLSRIMPMKSAHRVDRND